MTDSKDQPNAACYNCGKPHIVVYSGQPLCVDCFHKISQAYFMAQQITHNQLSWNASNLNFVEQELYSRTGGLLPLKQMRIPPPLTAPKYIYSEIKVTDSSIGIINTGTLTNIDTGIQVMHNQGNTELATAIKTLIQAVIDSKEIDKETQALIVEQLEFLMSESLKHKERQNRHLAITILNTLSNSISTIASLLTIWKTVEPLFRSQFGI